MFRARAVRRSWRSPLNEVDPLPSGKCIGLIAKVGLEVASMGYERLHFLDLAPKMLRLDLADAEVQSQRFRND
jgi:hypothetical protein